MTRKNQAKNLPNRITISLGVAQHAGLAHVADESRRSVAFVIREAVDEYLRSRRYLTPTKKNHP